MCIIDAPVNDCQSAPLGRCVPYNLSNTCLLSPSDQWCGSCLVLFGTTCTSFPDYSCGNTGCVAAGCVAHLDGGVDAW